MLNCILLLLKRIVTPVRPSYVWLGHLVYINIPIYMHYAYRYLAVHIHRTLYCVCNIMIFGVYTCKRVWICFFFAPDPMSIFRTETIRRRYVGTQKNVSDFTRSPPPASINTVIIFTYPHTSIYYTWYRVFIIIYGSSCRGGRRSRSNRTCTRYLYIIYLYTTNI